MPLEMYLVYSSLIAVIPLLMPPEIHLVIPPGMPHEVHLYRPTIPPKMPPFTCQSSSHTPKKVYISNRVSLVSR